jgi:hypothetical protein
MKWSELFTSSVGKKWVMALTGLGLILFLGCSCYGKCLYLGGGL